MKHTIREHQRIYLTFHLRLYNGANFTGFLIDISRDGFMIMSDSRLQPEKDYDFRIKLPDSFESSELRDLNKDIEFSSTCCWTKPYEMDRSFNIGGFKFTKLGDTENKFIHALIKEFRA